MTEDTSIGNRRAPQKKQTDDHSEQYRRIGAELRQRREALSLEQADVARRLRLPGMIINDIETGRVEQLSSLYRRGYIRNYARLLELDPETLLAGTDSDLPPDLRQVLPVPHREWRLERYLKFVTYIIVTIAIAPPLVYFFVAGGTRMFDADTNSGEPAAVAQLAAQEGPDDRSAPAAPPQRLQASPAAHVSASALPLNPARSLRETRTETAAVAPDLLPQTEVPARAHSTLGLKLRADSWVEIHDAAGKRLEYDLLRAGQARSYEGEAPFRLLLGRSNAVSLQIDGQPVSWEGENRGDIAEFDVAASGEVR